MSHRCAWPRTTPMRSFLPRYLLPTSRMSCFVLKSSRTSRSRFGMQSTGSPHMKFRPYTTCWKEDWLGVSSSGSPQSHCLLALNPGPIHPLILISCFMLFSHAPAYEIAGDDDVQGLWNRAWQTFPALCWTPPPCSPTSSSSASPPTSISLPRYASY